MDWPAIVFMISCCEVLVDEREYWWRYPYSDIFSNEVHGCKQLEFCQASGGNLLQIDTVTILSVDCAPWIMFLDRTLQSKRVSENKSNF